MKIKHSHIHSFPSSPHSCPNLDVVVSSSDDGPNKALPTYIIKSKAQSPRPSGPLRGGKRKCETESTLKIEQHPHTVSSPRRALFGPIHPRGRTIPRVEFLFVIYSCFSLPHSPQSRLVVRPRVVSVISVYLCMSFWAHRRRRFGKRRMMGSWTTGAEKSMLIP